MDIVSSDFEFETIEDREKFWTGIDFGQPDFANFRKKYPDLAETGATREILQVH